MNRGRAALSRLAVVLAGLYAVDRLAKVAATERFLRQPPPPEPADWPPVAMLHPITRVVAGRSGLAANLRACARLDYPAPVRHLLLCDAGDEESQTVCHAVLAESPGFCGEVVVVPDGPGMGEAGDGGFAGAQHDSQEAEAIRKASSPPRHSEWSEAERRIRPPVAHCEPSSSLLPAAPSSPIAPKLVKLQAGLAHLASSSSFGDMSCDVVAFLDDDIAPRPATLRLLVAALHRSAPPVGAAFGLPCYTNWRTPWSSLLGAFNNANFPLANAALTYLAEPPRLTGHLVTFPLATFLAAGGLDGLGDQIDDDFALARRLRAAGTGLAQTAARYDVDNDLASWAAFARQVRRWFVLPRQAMAGALTPREAGAGLLVSAGLLLPPVVAALAAVARTRAAWGALLACLALFVAVAARSERRYLASPAPMPSHRRWLLPLVATLVPAQAVAALLAGGDEVEWRGQRLRIAPGGRFERLP